MLHCETDRIIEKLHDLYAGWNPTATQLEATKHKLTNFTIEDANEAVLETYDPAKRVAPLDEVFKACIGKVAKRTKAKKEIEQQQVETVQVVTDEERLRILIEGAEEGNGVCQALCRKRGIAFKERVEIPF